ncbi:hypothetical protein BJ912DRAFT_422595 [Pholiota molesta]|nr:hypothetical protein BJ912DRAFT_422595 [Pholiota molesta]
MMWIMLLGIYLLWLSISLRLSIRMRFSVCLWFSVYMWPAIRMWFWFSIRLRLRWRLANDAPFTAVQHASPSVSCDTYDAWLGARIDPCPCPCPCPCLNADGAYVGPPAESVDGGTGDGGCTRCGSLRTCSAPATQGPASLAEAAAAMLA